MATMLPKKEIVVGGEYVVYPRNAYNDHLDAWVPAIVLSEERIPATSVMGYGVAVADRPFHPRFKKGIKGHYEDTWALHPISDVQWSYAVVSHRKFRQFLKDWFTDMFPALQKKRDGIAQWRKDEKVRAKQAKERAKERAKEQEKLRKEQEKAREALHGEEATLRTVLNNFGINDSDGWRGINTKQRFSNEKNEYVMETYVRHLTLADVLRLTGGLKEPKAATEAKAKAKKKTTAKKTTAKRAAKK